MNFQQRQGRMGAIKRRHQHENSGGSGSSSSDYSSSPSPSPSPPRQWSRSHSYSSSDYSSLEEDEMRSGAPGYGQNTTKASLVLGRRLNPKGKEWGVLKKNCQFVKRALCDPAIEDSNSKERPSFITADTVSPADEAVDPRLSKAWYAEACDAVRPNPLKRVIFIWDEASSQGQPPPCTVLLKGFPSTVISKSLLINLMEASIKLALSELVKDVQLGNGIALLTLRDPKSSSQLVSLVARCASNPLQGIDWIAKFDPNGEEFKQLTLPKTEKMAPSSVKAKRATGSHHLKGKLACSRRVPCVLIDYSIVPSATRMRRVEDIFRHSRLYNVERGKDAWHVHLSDEGEVEHVNNHPLQVRFGDDPLPFTIRLLAVPAEALQFKNTFSNPHDRRAGDCHNVLSRQLRGPSSDSVAFSATPIVVSKPISRPNSRMNLGNLYQPYTNLSILDGIFATVPPVATDLEATSAISALPSFNKRVLERQKLAEEQAVAAAAMAAEEARLALEARLAAETVNQAREQEREIRRQQRLTKKRLQGSTVPLKAPVEIALKRHIMGCARAEGYYTQNPSDKAVFIEDLVHLTTSSSQSDPTAATAGGSSGPTTMHQGASSRSNRAQNRRLQFSREPGSSDLFGKSGAFAARKKNLILGRSSIHSWGLFAGEDIEAGDMVVEYVGEVIRHSVANVRERRYELALRARGSSDIASSYLFRLSADHVIDATNKGNISRFINHSCDPTCMARILDGKRIILYARRDIQRGEEITYDYKFPREEDPAKKIKCLCGTRHCRSYLN